MRGKPAVHKKSWIILILGFVLAGLAVAGFIWPRVMRADIIWERGIGTADKLNDLFIPIGIAAILLLALGMYRRWRENAERMRELKQMLSAQEEARRLAEAQAEQQRMRDRAEIYDAEGNLRPEYVRARLADLKANHPAYAELLDECLKHVEYIREDRERLSVLMRANADDKLLPTAAPVLANIEQAILHNLFQIINTGIVVRTSGAIDTKPEQEFQRLIEEKLRITGSALESCQMCLFGAAGTAGQREAATATAEATMDIKSLTMLAETLKAASSTQSPFRPANE